MLHILAGGGAAGECCAVLETISATKVELVLSQSLIEHKFFGCTSKSFQFSRKRSDFIESFALVSLNI